MYFQKIEYFSEKELIRRIRRTPLRGSNIFPYKDCDIYIKTFRKKSASRIIRPCQFYYLKHNYETILMTINDIYCHGLDPYELNGFLRLHEENEKDDTIEIHDFLPPILEHTNIHGYLLCDGLHRVKNWIDDNSERYLDCLVIDDPSSPYYALPNPNGWSDVKECIKPPKVKKLYRFDNYRDYFKDFNIEFKNVSKERK